MVERQTNMYKGMPAETAMMQGAGGDTILLSVRHIC